MHKGTPVEARAVLTASQLVIHLGDEYSQTLKNPFSDETARVKLAVLEYDSESHLLVTVSDDRVTDGWVLVPEDSGFQVALTLEVDDGISVVNNVVKASHREYGDDGYHIVSELYRFDPQTGMYAKIVP